MGNISIKLNLNQLKHVVKDFTGKDGKTKVKCLVIPIDENMIYQGEKGNYLNITAIEIKDRSKFSADQKDTHLLKQDIPRDKYESMTDEEKKSMPILGNAILWGGRSEPEPQISYALSDSAVDQYNDDVDDLPF